MSEPINKAELRRLLVQQAVDTEYYWRELVGADNIRVSAATFEEAKAHLMTWVRAKISKTQRKGKTL